MNRLYGLAGVGVIAATVLATPPALAATEIEWWHAMSGRLGELLAAQVDAFNASQADYQVVGVYKGNYSETLNAGVAAFRAGRQPEILQVFEIGTATMMAAKGAVRPAYEIMAEAGEPFDPADYLPAVDGYYTTSDGRLVSFPYNSSTPVFFYNKDAFVKAGLDPEQPPKTWDTIEAAAKALKASGSTCPLTTAWQSWIHLENFSAWHDRPFATRANGFEGLDAELVFNHPLQVRHIETLGRWAKEGLFIYSGRRNEGSARFRAGECAMLTESSAGYAGIKAEAKFAWAVSNLPYWGDVAGAPQNTFIGGASLWVLAGHTAEEYRGVAKFFSFLSRPAVQAKYHQDTGYLPVTPVAYQLTKEQGFYAANPGTEIALVQMTAKPPTENSKGLRLGSFDQIRTLIDEELEEVWSGKKPAQAALDSAVARGNELLRRFEAANR
ncbi:MAG: sn-glycerol-3-phosphate ABC transporter substrate-binding protein UgpB [Azospirillum sp.]|nr:sn-glycerol-3-phosphate ABC transporter substrate-binding protein UgpB [Azospirillum sp.]